MPLHKTSPESSFIEQHFSWILAFKERRDNEMYFVIATKSEPRREMSNPIYEDFGLSALLTSENNTLEA